jgi:(4S)-4-hydroxy-5-phosphonooxypentane-2,3-dione isomerase
MLIVHVQVLVKTDLVSDFIAATLENAAASLNEPGVARFDVIRDCQVPNRFVLVEVYRDAQAPALHKETAHYAKWRDTVADMMQVQRTSERFENVFPDERGWDTPKWC